MGSNEQLSPDTALSLIEAHGVGTWAWHFADARVSWSAGMSRILGVQHMPETQTLESYESLLHPDDRADFRSSAGVVANGDMTDREYRVLRPGGELRWVRSFGKLIHARDGRPERLIGVGFDITDVRQGLHAFQQREGLMQAFRDLFDVVVWTTDGSGEVSDEIDWWRSTGQRGRVDKWNRLDAVHPDDRHKVREAWAEALRNRQRYSVTCRVQWGDAFVPVLSRAVAITGRNGTVDAWVGFTARQDSMALTMGFPTDAAPPLTPGQVRAARGYLGWSAEQLSDQAGVSFSTVRRVETPGERGVREQSITAIRTALERAGIVFSTGADGRTGVSMKQ